MEKVRRNRAATVERILGALEKILNEDGLAGVSINAVADQAGVSKVLIYRYFGGLDHLLEHYVETNGLLPHYTTAWLEQIRPAQPRDLATVWSAHTLQLFRQFRGSRAARELIKATVNEHDALAKSVSKGLDAELTNLVNQLAFIKGGDHEATSAVILGALSYLIIQAQLDHKVIGLDLRSEEDWQRIEAAVNLIYKALNRVAIESPDIQLAVKSATATANRW
ncbi:TetR/AcrR family transcriptional regulator [Spirosoma koreense]